MTSLDKYGMVKLDCEGEQVMKRERIVMALVNAFPGVFLTLRTVAPTKDMVLTGYLHVNIAGETVAVHAHYVAPGEEEGVIHEHQGGARVHNHEEGW